MACIEKATDEDHDLWISGLYRFVLGYRVEVVGPNVCITCRVRPIECDDYNALSLYQYSSVLFHTNIRVGFCQFGKNTKSCLEICFFIFEGEPEIWS